MHSLTAARLSTGAEPAVAAATAATTDAPFSLPCSFQCTTGALTFGQFPQLLAALTTTTTRGDAEAAAGDDCFMSPARDRVTPSLPGGTIIQRRYTYKCRALPGTWHVKRFYRNDDHMVLGSTSAASTNNRRNPVLCGIVVHHESVTAASVFRRCQKVGVSHENKHADTNVFYVNRYDWSFHFRWPRASAPLLLSAACRASVHAAAITTLKREIRDPPYDEIAPGHLRGRQRRLHTLTAEQLAAEDAADTLDVENATDPDLIAKRDVAIERALEEELRNTFRGLYSNCLFVMDYDHPLLLDSFVGTLRKNPRWLSSRDANANGLQVRPAHMFLRECASSTTTASASSSSSSSSSSSAIPVGVHFPYHDGEYELGWLVYGDADNTSPQPLVGLVYDAAYCHLANDAAYLVEEEVVVTADEARAQRAEMERVCREQWERWQQEEDARAAAEEAEAAEQQQ